MSRLNIPAREAAHKDSAPLLDAVEGQLGVVPNLFRLVGQSPAALNGLLALNTMSEIAKAPSGNGIANIDPTGALRIAAPIAHATASAFMNVRDAIQSCSMCAMGMM